MQAQGTSITIHVLLHWPVQFPGWNGLELEALFKLCTCRRAREFFAVTVCVAVSPVFWFSTTVPCVMIRLSVFLSIASDR